MREGSGAEGEERSVGSREGENEKLMERGWKE